MPVVREPIPPADHRGVTKTFTDAPVWLALVLGLVFTIFVIWLMESMVTTERDHQQFMKQCIEFNHVDRCQELYRYDRRDLMNRRDK